MSNYSNIPNSDAKNTLANRRVINSLFTKLDGDFQNFHQIGDLLKDDPIVQLKPHQDILLIDCIKDRIRPYHGRGYLATDSKIYLCGNTIWKSLIASDRKAIQSLITHELIHLYDKKVKNFNFYNSRDLACSEIRAYNLANNCNGSPMCVFNKTNNSLKLAEATRFLQDSERKMIISGVIKECMQDRTPFDMSFTYENSKDRQSRLIREAKLEMKDDDKADKE